MFMRPTPMQVRTRMYAYGRLKTNIQRLRLSLSILEQLYHSSTPLFRQSCLFLVFLCSPPGTEDLKGQSHEMFKALFKYGLIDLGQERNR